MLLLLWSRLVQAPVALLQLLLHECWHHGGQVDSAGDGCCLQLSSITLESAVLDGLQQA